MLPPKKLVNFVIRAPGQGAHRPCPNEGDDTDGYADDRKF
jgi:hypothetical protein